MSAIIVNAAFLKSHARTIAKLRKQLDAQVEKGEEIDKKYDQRLRFFELCLEEKTTDEIVESVGLSAGTLKNLSAKFASTNDVEACLERKAKAGREPVLTDEALAKVKEVLADGLYRSSDQIQAIVDEAVGKELNYSSSYLMAALRKAGILIMSETHYRVCTQEELDAQTAEREAAKEAAALKKAEREAAKKAKAEAVEAGAEGETAEDSEVDEDDDDTSEEDEESDDDSEDDGDDD